MNRDTKQNYIAEICRLNDQFRTTFVGGAILITPAVEALALDQRSALLAQIRSFDDFSNDNDPYGEHDFGAIECMNEKYFFKIDYYDPSMERGSPDPAARRAS
jgi:hypothetical protein